MIDSRSLEKRWKDFLEFVGLDQFDPESILHPDQSGSICLVYRISSRDLASCQSDLSKVTDVILKPIADAIGESKFAKSMVSDLRKELEKAKSQVESLRTEVQSLLPYKQHFEVEMKLRHGAGEAG